MNEKDLKDYSFGKYILEFTELPIKELIRMIEEERKKIRESRKKKIQEEIK